MLRSTAGLCRFRQNQPGGVTNVDVQLMSTTGQARHFGEYGVFERPVDARNPPATRCSAQAVGDRYNPAGKPPCTYSNRVDCALGDLTGKFGFFPQSRVASQFFDNNLPLGGTNSIVGRSIVLSDSDGARWICATIAPMTDANVNAAGQNCSQLAAMGSCVGKVFATAALIAGINVSALFPTSCPTLQGAAGAGSAADLTPAPRPTESVAISTTAPTTGPSLPATDDPAPVPRATAVPVDTMTTSPVAQASAAPSSKPPSGVPSTAMPSGAAALIGAPAKAATSNVPARYDGCLPRDPGAMFRPPCIPYALRPATHAVRDMCRAAPATVLTLAALVAAALLVS